MQAHYRYQVWPENCFHCKIWIVAIEIWVQVPPPSNRMWIAVQVFFCGIWYWATRFSLVFEICFAGFLEFKLPSHDGLITRQIFETSPSIESQLIGLDTKQVYLFYFQNNKGFLGYLGQAFCLVNNRNPEVCMLNLVALEAITFKTCKKILPLRRCAIWMQKAWWVLGLGSTICSFLMPMIVIDIMLWWIMYAKVPFI